MSDTEFTFDDSDDAELIPRSIPRDTPLREIVRWADEEVERANRRLDRALRRAGQPATREDTTS